MIVAHRLHVVKLIKAVGLPLVILVAYNIGVTYLYLHERVALLAQDNLPLSLVGTAVALIVTLRNNAAYSRWWEGRTLWGQTVNESRSFVRGLISMTSDVALQISLTKHQVAYAHALRRHLLRSQPWDDLARLLPRETLQRIGAASNVPLALHTIIADRLGQARASGAIDAISMSALNVSQSALLSAQGGLERIKNTPLPRQYSQFPHLFVRLFCFALPLGLVHDLGYFTPIGSTVVGFMFLALDQVGIDLEDPFEGTLHDVPMNAITRAIEVDLHQMVGQVSTPPKPKIHTGVLD